MAAPHDPLAKYKKIRLDNLNLDNTNLSDIELSKAVKIEQERRKQTGEKQQHISALDEQVTEKNINQAEDYNSAEAVKARQDQHTQNLIHQENTLRAQRMAAADKGFNPQSISMNDLLKRQDVEIEDLSKSHQIDWDSYDKRVIRDRAELAETHRTAEAALESELKSGMKDLDSKEKQQINELKTEAKKFDAKQQKDLRELTTKHKNEKSNEAKERSELSKQQKEEIKNLKAEQKKELDKLPKDAHEQRKSLVQAHEKKLEAKQAEHVKAQKALEGKHVNNDAGRKENINQLTKDKQVFQNKQKEEYNKFKENQQQRRAVLENDVKKKRQDVSNQKDQSTQQLSKTHQQQKDTLATSQTQAKNAMQQRHKQERIVLQEKINLENQTKQQATPQAQPQSPISSNTTTNQPQLLSPISNTKPTPNASLAASAQRNPNMIQQAQRNQPAARPQAGQPLTAQQKIKLNQTTAANKEQLQERVAAQEEALLSAPENAPSAAQRLENTPYKGPGYTETPTTTSSESDEQEHKGPQASK